MKKIGFKALSVCCYHYTTTLLRVFTLPLPDSEAIFYSLNFFERALLHTDEWMNVFTLQSAVIQIYDGEGL